MSETQTVNHAREDIHSHSFWVSPEGRAAKAFLEGWGAVLRERKLSGDPTAVPAGMDRVAKHKRGSPSDPPDVLLQFCQVEQDLPLMATDSVRRLLEWIYVDGLDWRMKRRFLFPDATWSDWMSENDPVPVMRTLGSEEKAFPFYRYSIQAFSCPDARAICEEWGIEWSEFLHREHRRFAREFGKSLLPKKNA